VSRPFSFNRSAGHKCSWSDRRRRSVVSYSAVPDDDEVIIHFARIHGRYVISSPAYCGDAAGYDFRALVRA